MKKLFYLVPFVLIGLSALSVPLYKDKVDFLLSKDPNAKVEDLSGALTKLSPSHWKMIDFQTNASANLGAASFSFDSSDTSTTTDNPPATQTPKTEPLYQGAKFKGFPFAAYFSKSSSTNTANDSSSMSASGYSWLWGIVDLLLIIVSLVISFRVNRKKREDSPAAQPVAAQSGAVASTTPQAGSVQSGVFTPAQSPSPQPNSEPPQSPPQA
jgi:hypothetical protein